MMNPFDTGAKNFGEHYKILVQTLGEEIALEMTKRFDEDLRIKIGLDDFTPPEVLTALTDDSYWRVRWAVACNPLTPKPSLMKLACDEVLVIRKMVACNESTPATVLTKLADEDDIELLTMIASHPNATDRIRARAPKALRNVGAVARAVAGVKNNQVSVSNPMNVILHNNPPAFTVS